MSTLLWALGFWKEDWHEGREGAQRSLGELGDRLAGTYSSNPTPISLSARVPKVSKAPLVSLASLEPQ